MNETIRTSVPPTNRQARNAAAGKRPTAAAPASAVGNDHINILIVDDEPKNLTVLQAILDDPSYRLVRAASADDALLALLSEEFALLILDIHMPGVTGFELANMIRERRKTALVPIIFLTAYYNEEQDVLEGYGAGAVDYLHKPINAAILRSKVAVFAELQRKGQEIAATNRALLAEVTERRRVEAQLREMNTTLEQRVTERTQVLQLTMYEVNHRAKNLLAVVQAIARQSARKSSYKQFAEHFGERLAGLAASHDLLVRSEWQGVDARELIRSQLAHFDDIIGTRMALDGPPVQLTVQASQAIGMAIHELATNATKYGALSNAEGTISIAWELVAAPGVVDAQALFRIQWSEQGGPSITPPEHRGFGHMVIVDMVKQSLDAEVLLAYPPTGLSWQMGAPAERVCGAGEIFE